MLFLKKRRPSAGEETFRQLFGFSRKSLNKQLYQDRKIRALANAADDGDVQSKFLLGCYWIEKDNDAAGLGIGHLKEAADLGHTQAMLLFIARLVAPARDNFTPSFTLFLSFLGLQLVRFNLDVPWFTEACETGQACRFLRYAKMASKGKHIETLLPLVADAEMGSPLAMALLASYYESGHGFPQDFTQAYIWFSVAASLGLRSAVTARDTVANKLTPQALLDAQAISGQIYDDIARRIADNATPATAEPAPPIR